MMIPVRLPPPRCGAAWLRIAVVGLLAVRRLLRGHLPVRVRLPVGLLRGRTLLWVAVTGRRGLRWAVSGLRGLRLAVTARLGLAVAPLLRRLGLAVTALLRLAVAAALGLLPVRVRWRLVVTHGLRPLR